MQMIPNVHLLGLFVASITLAYRVRALIPLYVYIMLDGVFLGFSMFWMPYLYVWLPLWLMFLLAGKLKLPIKFQVPLYMVLCGLHGLSFGLLYAPAQALIFGLSFQSMVAWIIAGIPFDIIHAAGNFAAGTLIVPLAALLKRLDKRYG
jgi:energy-coupling factor transport system substrate-specific component